jgi:four helix bundle protein
VGHGSGGKNKDTYRDLEIWRLGIEIVKDVYRLTSRFPQHELYGLTGQMRRSAISIPSNVAEGFRRQYAKEYRQFLRVSLGSCAELETQTTIARELSYMSIGEEAELLDKLDHECRMISSLTKKL